MYVSELMNLMRCAGYRNFYLPVTKVLVHYISSYTYFPGYVCVLRISMQVASMASVSVETKDEVYHVWQ